MTHMHIAGALHTLVAAPSPQWLNPPSDLNALPPVLWSQTATRKDDGELTIGGVSVSEMITEHGSPVYVIDEADFRARARRYREAFQGWDVKYAAKAFITKSIARWVKEENLHLDVCSGGELETALAADFPPARIGFHGNNKSVAELARAMEVGVGTIIVDSMNEIDRLEELSAQLGTKATVLVRVTVGVEAHTHEYIATAHEDQKFGFSLATGDALNAMLACHESPHIDLVGIHSHIGSQIFDTAGFEVAARRTMELLKQFREHTGVELPELNLGGGFGIAYTEVDQPLTPAEIADDLRSIVTAEAESLNMVVPHVSIEPGRSIVGPAGIALYTIGTIKPVQLEDSSARVYVSVDGGMSDNIRPALYGAEYTAVLANRASDAPPVLCRVVGKHCESGDIIVHDVYLPSDIEVADILAVPASGAYSRSMASNYNHVPRPAVIAAHDGSTYPMLRRETVADLLALDVGE